MRTVFVLLVLVSLALAAAGAESQAQLSAASRGGPSEPYRFAATGPDGSPARWDPCSAHRVYVDLRHAPAGAVADLVAAFGRADAVSGLRFHLAGGTRAGLNRSWRSRTTGRSPSAWAPITVRWAPPGQPLAIPGKAALTRTSWVTDPRGRDIYVTASITFASTAGRQHSTGAGRPELRAIAEHEIGHLLGLAHVSDPHQLMYAVVGRVTGYGPGDRTGLRRLGHGSCLPTPRRSP